MGHQKSQQTSRNASSSEHTRRPTGTLFVVGTPIGCPDDLTLRARTILTRVSIEDRSCAEGQIVRASDGCPDDEERAGGTASVLGTGCVARGLLTLLMSHRYNSTHLPRPIVLKSSGDRPHGR